MYGGEHISIAGILSGLIKKSRNRWRFFSWPIPLGKKLILPMFWLDALVLLRVTRASSRKVGNIKSLIKWSCQEENLHRFMFTGAPENLYIHKFLSVMFGNRYWTSPEMMQCHAWYQHRFIGDWEQLANKLTLGHLRGETRRYELIVVLLRAVVDGHLSAPAFVQPVAEALVHAVVQREPPPH